ncbi:MAG: RNA polymerase sigma factor RpoE [Magnetococcus sp. WYHC-3]
MSEADQLLVERVKKGDKRAFELLVRKYQGRVAAVIGRIVPDAGRVQDLTQEAFLKAYRALGNFRGDSAFYTWLYRIAVNTAKNHLMSQDRGVPMSDLELEDADNIATEFRENDTPERLLLRRELIRNLQEAIAALPDSMRHAIELREVQGRSYEEISEIMGCPIGTVRSRIFRGRQEIIERMKPYLGGGSGGGTGLG